MPRFDKPDRSAAIGARLCIARVTAGLSRTGLAARLGLSHQQIEKYERGADRLPAVMLADLGRVLARAPAFFVETDDAAVARALLLELPDHKIHARQLDRAVRALGRLGKSPATADGRSSASALNATDRFDAEATWTGMHEAVRTAIGTAVLNMLAAGEVIEHAIETDDGRLARVGLAAKARARRALDYVLGEFSIAGLAGLTPEGEPRIPALLGMVCERCGCSEDDACPGGCGWARDNLCTACDGAGHGA